MMLDYTRKGIEARIRAGFFTPGTFLPNQTELARRFSVSRPTIARAFMHLIEDGYLCRDGQALFSVNSSHKWPGKGLIPQDYYAKFGNETAFNREIRFNTHIQGIEELKNYACLEFQSAVGAGEASKSRLRKLWLPNEPGYPLWEEEDETDRSVGKVNSL